MVYWISYFIAKIIDWLFLNCRFVGWENLPQDSGYILASNHISNLDPFILGLSCRCRASYMAKESLFKPRFSAWFLPRVGAFPIKRDTSDFRAIREAVRRLKKGNPVILFPEGTRGGSERGKKIHSGIGFIAVKSGKPVVPVSIVGTDKALPPGARWIRRHPVLVKIGEPLIFKKEQSYLEISSQIMSAIEDLLK